MILSCNEVKKTYIDNHVLTDVTFHLNERDKVALIGQNGCGKTTLLRIIMGVENSDSGLVTISKDTTIGYLPQNALLNSNRTIYDEVLSVKNDLIALEKEIEEMHNAMNLLSGTELDEMINKANVASQKFEAEGGYVFKSEVRGILLGLGFAAEDFDKTVDKLSGGQKTRVALGKILLNKPDLIILDEPTNHLDMNSIAWLENYLLNLKKTVFVVSHDRYFLDKIVNKVVEIEGGKTTTFDGNYSDYAVKKEMLRTAALNAYIKQQAMIEHQEAVIEKLRSFNREKSIKRAESRVKMLDKIDRLDKPVEYTDEMRLTLTPRIESGKDVLEVNGLTKSFGNTHLFADVSMSVKRGEHVAIIGDNGTGKTTLLKILNGIEHADAGDFSLGSRVTIGYYDQEHHVLDDSKTVFEEISDAYPNLNNTEIRNVLAAFLFTGDDVLKRISSLSGGEKGRVSLAKLMLSEANFLILDEPTNHLDIASKEILEQALNSYEGTLLYVSHDRYFINRTADRILELKSNCFTEFLGDYDYYLEKRENIIRDNNDSASYSNVSFAVTTEKSAGDSKADWKAGKQKQAEIRKLEKKLAEVETKIEKLEDEQAKINEKMLLPDIATNSAKLNELSARLSDIDDELMSLMEDWEKVSGELEAYN